MQIILTEDEFNELKERESAGGKARSSLYSIQHLAELLLTDKNVDLPCKDSFDPSKSSQTYYCDGCIIGKLTPANLGCTARYCLAGRTMRYSK